jgi:hypothetical protein
LIFKTTSCRFFASDRCVEHGRSILSVADRQKPSPISPIQGLFTRITTALPEFPEGSAERANALLNLGNIRRVLARRDYSP